MTFGLGMNIGGLMAMLDGKVVIVTGAGRGLGRSNAMLMAQEGASVVVNDLGGEWDGTGADPRAASEVADEITSFGGRAVANFSDVADWEGAQHMINQAIEALAPLGTLALLGIGIPEFTMDVRSVISGGKTIRGVIEGDATPHEFIPRLIELHREGRLPLEKLIRTYEFEEIDRAFAEAASGDAIKPVLIF